MSIAQFIRVMTRFIYSIHRYTHKNRQINIYFDNKKFLYIYLVKLIYL